jgi:hypothetical protein
MPDRDVKIPQIPAVPEVESRRLFDFLQAVKTNLSLRDGLFSNALHKRFVTKAEFDSTVNDLVKRIEDLEAP